MKKLLCLAVLSFSAAAAPVFAGVDIVPPSREVVESRPAVVEQTVYQTAYVAAPVAYYPGRAYYPRRAYYRAPRVGVYVGPRRGYYARGPRAAVVVRPRRWR